MFSRLTRMIAGFTAVLAVYWMYALIAVPIIEPSVKPRSKVELTPAERAAAQNAGQRHKHVFAKYFKPGDWELDGNPKVVESSQAKLLVQQYHTEQDGSVKLTPCTLIFFPNPGKKDASGEEQVILMRAPEGAVLQFEDGFDLLGGKVGKLKGGMLKGKITICSAPTKPDSTEDLLITTHDVELLDDRIWTPHPVQFRMGKNHGSGREMRINLVKTDAPKNKGPAAHFGEIESFELVRDVKLHVQMEPGSANQSKLLGGDKRQDARTSQPTREEAKPEPPVEVTCQGPFKFDVSRSLATFTDQVDVVRLNPEGPSDQLNCELLAIQFGPRERPIKQRAAVARDQGVERGDIKEAKPKSNQFDLEPRRIEAVGDPVVIRAPSQGGHARCQRLEYDVKTERIVLEGNEDIHLNLGSNVIRTRHFEYRPGEAGRLGWLQVAGPGWLQGALEDRPGQKYQAQWNKELRMRPQGEAHVASLEGAAQVRYSEMGALSADEIHLWFSQTTNPRVTRNVSQVVTANYAPGSIKEDSGEAAIGATGTQPRSHTSTNRPSTTRRPQLEITPDRLLAQTNVRIDAPQLTGATRRLEVWFQQASGDSASIGSRTRSSTSKSRDPRAPKQTFDIRGDLMRLQVLMLPEEKITRLSEVSIEGGARLVETKTKKLDETPLVVQGDRLQVAQADSDEAQVSVAGKPATVEARGLALIGAKINLDRGANRLWIDGPGRMRLPMDRDLNGQVLAQRQTMEIDWQGGMQFDGKTVIYDRAVTARGEHQSLKTESLEVSLRRRIDFNNPQLPANQRGALSSVRAAGGQGDAADVETFICRGGVTLQNKSFDTEGQLSADQMQMRDIAINQVSGVIEGHGPGWITTVRRGQPGGGLGSGFGGGTPAKSAPAEKVDEKKYSFLNVRFEGPIGGNVQRQELTFSDQVRAVYGPVEDWQSELDPDAPDELDPQAVLLNCDQLTVRQMPSTTRGGNTTAELEAIGNTLVEGQTFTARAHKLSFAEAKELLVLEGNGSVDAQIFRQAHPGSATSETAARKMLYWRSTNQVRVEDARRLDIGNLPAGKSNGSSNGGFPNLFKSKDKNSKDSLGSDARRSPHGNGTALPSVKQ